MNKEIELLVAMCNSNRNNFSAEDLAALLKLKFVEGVYPYVRKLKEATLIEQKERGIYSINEESEKVVIIRFMLKVFGDEIDLLFTTHTKRVLERFSIKPILAATELPYSNLRLVKDIAKKTRILYYKKEGNSTIYVLRTWEEPTQKLLEFFGIKLNFDPEEHKLRFTKLISTFGAKQSHLKDGRSGELAQLNMQAYLEGKDFIVNKLRVQALSELSVIDALTSMKTKKLTNIFEITSRINDWKIKYIYNTDKIEGNTLTLEDVRTILTIGSGYVKKEKRDVLETINSRTALDNIFDTHNELTEEFIKKLHLATQQGIDTDAGKYKTDENCIVDDSGNLIDTTTPARFVEERIGPLIKWYNDNKTKFHPIVTASVVHNQLVYIHPFSDGNGRVARLLLNFILIKSGYFPVIIYNDQKQKYYSVLRQSKSGDITPFVAHIAELYRTQLETF